MTATVPTAPTVAPVKGARLALLVAGLLAIGFGIAVLAWPTKAAVALTGVIALYAVVAGGVYVALGLLSTSLGTWGRIGHVLLGILYLIAGVSAFSSLQQSAAFLALFLTIMVGVMWVAEGITALFTLRRSGSRVLTIVFAVLSVLAGVTLLSSPLFGAVLLWWFLGVSLVVLGVLNAVRAIVGTSH
ncbi:HdeD family acid-resistance protein [Brachybacterium saurashtrense]|uniref:HdeD family acid-resistance protein n=1 Tax=Brachybacterium saurashtrense TaxID=556288 RepID=A0A345YKW9_9MICO|nr:DUF308 domain-containing protein [Brachybacterium saurashtrense]AXK44571.1 hypothetical protein DWV08_02325 [Brachybacterium saurashtrense]RRR23183.1 hypothetical protein DXU92_07455 [Brachybacterium saurashtrense]